MRKSDFFPGMRLDGRFIQGMEDPRDPDQRVILDLAFESEHGRPPRNNPEFEMWRQKRFDRTVNEIRALLFNS